MKTFYHIVCIAALLVFAYLLGSMRKKIDLLPQNERYEADNVTLRRQADSLQTVANRFETVADSLQIVIKRHEFSLDSLKSLQSLNSLKHENQIRRIDAMPADSLYLFFTEYIK